MYEKRRKNNEQGKECEGKEGVDGRERMRNDGGLYMIKKKIIGFSPFL